MGEEHEEDDTQYGNDDYKDTECIFDFAPKPKANDWKPKPLRQASPQDCLIHGPKWKERVKEIIELFERLHSTIIKVDVIEKGLCSCNKKADSSPNMPTALLHQNAWELHLFFQNGLNHLTFSRDDTFSSKLRNTLSEVLQECLAYNDNHRYIFLKWIRVLIIHNSRTMLSGSSEIRVSNDSTTVSQLIET